MLYDSSDALLAERPNGPVGRQFALYFLPSGAAAPEECSVPTRVQATASSECWQLIPQAEQASYRPRRDDHNYERTFLSVKLGDGVVTTPNGGRVAVRMVLLGNHEYPHRPFPAAFVQFV